MRTLTRLTCLLLAGWASTAQAQQPVTLDIRTVVAMPGDLAGADLTTGLGFGATLAFRLQPHLHLYGGWDWLQFGADQGFAGADRDFMETGYTFGLRFEHPLGDASRLLYRLEAGGTYKHVEVENQDGDLLVDSGHSLGWEGGLGLVWPMGNTWRLGPTLRYRSLKPEFEVGNITTSGTLSYIGLELGISRKF